MTTEPAEGRPGVRRAFVWSMVNTVVLRLGNFAAGVVIARLIAPEEFGIFAVALSVHAVLGSIADLGLSADLIRNGRIRERAATATTVGLVASGLLAAGMAVTAGPVAAALGSRDATPVVQVMALALLLQGAALVPYSILQREFRQKAVFATEVASFVVTNGLTVALILMDLGAMSLAIARVAAQAIVCLMMFGLTRVRPRLGHERAVAASLLRFGVPVAGANLLSMVVMNVDYMVVGGLAGAVILGYYLLAFNVSSWPMTALGMGVRAVALPAFSRLTGRRLAESLGSAVALVWGCALLVGAVLATLAHPVVILIYGERWAPAAAALAGLAYFGAARVVIDLMATYLVAAGATRAVLLVQVAWLVGLLPAMIIGASKFGLAGAGWAHVAATLVVFPAYFVAVRRTGVALSRLIVPLAVPLVAAVPAVLATLLIGRVLDDRPLLAIVAGGAAGCAIYLAPVGPWLLRQYRTLRQIGGQRAEAEIETVTTVA
jgi:lipopolysaccharide exporter